MAKIGNQLVELPAYDDHDDVPNPTSGNATLYVYVAAGVYTVHIRESDGTHTPVDSGGGGGGTEILEVQIFS